MRVQYNGSFILDVTFIPIDDIFADGNGCYVNNGHSTHTYKRKKSGNWKKKSSHRKDPLQRDEFHLERHYKRLKEYPEFRQTVSYLRDQRGNIVDNVAIVQYIFKGNEHEIKLFPHGNAKESKPFTRTKPSAINALRQNLEKYHPNEALAKTRKEMGGCFSNASEASLPRGQSQAHNLKRTNANSTIVSGAKRSKDEMTALNWYAKTDGKNFVRMQEISDEPRIMIATDNQLDDLVRFCTSEIDFSCLSVDPTFNFGNFSVTPTSYRNLLLKSRKTGKSPVFIGPIFIHHTKQRATYKQFFDKLTSIRGQLSNVICYGTDGEKALSDALAEAFPLGIHLRCFRHFRGNFLSFLTNLKIGETRSYFEEVFGKQEGNVYQVGLVDAASEDEFDARLLSLRESWAKREKCAVENCQVYQWMEERSLMVKSCMLASVRTKAGLGNPPMKFYTNDSENTNRRLRDKTNGREQGETSFIRDMKELIEDSQETEVVLAMYGASEVYEVRESFRKFELQREEWFRMNEDQRRKYIRDIYSKSMEELYAAENNASIYAEKSDRHRERGTEKQGLSVESSLLLKLFDDYFLQCVWKKAKRLVSKPENILQAPSKDPQIKAFSAVSESSNIPNYVQVHSTAKVTCTCKLFPPKKICAHSVAVAEKEGILQQFVDWLVKTNCSSNVSLVATMNLNASRSGRKGGISKRKRHAPEPVTAVIDPFSGVVTPAIQPMSRQPVSNPSQQPIPSASSASPVQLPNTILSQNRVVLQTTWLENTFQGNGFVQNNQSRQTIWQPYLSQTETRSSCPAAASGNIHRNPANPVPPGIPLPPKPTVPESNNPYFLAQIRGNIAKCTGCNGAFKGARPFPPPDDNFIIGRKEKDWFPYTQPNGEKYWKLGREQNRYYHLSRACICARHPYFNPTQLRGLISTCSSFITVTPELIAALRMRFSQS
jgi:hypothetical protein